MRLFQFIAARGRDTFGLALWGYSYKHAYANVIKMLAGTGYAPHPRA